MSDVTLAGNLPSRVPPLAAWLGGFGLLPFIAGVVLVAGLDAKWALDPLRFYATVILSFLGGVHWGLAIDDLSGRAAWTRLGGSVLPALVAWLALSIAPAPGLLLLAATFVLLLLADVLAARKRIAPRWYPRLRVPLTAIVVACLVTAGLS
jgi:hypothetical protein